MEELLQREVEDLKRQQAELEGELLALGEPPVCHHTISPRRSRTALALAAPISAHSASDRMRELALIRRRYEREANRALSTYFSAVSNYPSYQAERERRLGDVRGFSFESRELQKAQRIRTRRLEAEREQREAATRHMLHQRFKANPVPPSTYMNKYALMLEEWRQRKATVEALAMEKAERLRAETELLRLSTKSMRSVREGMGQRRAQSAEPTDRRAVVELHEAPLEVKVRLWPALEEHEQWRKERVKQRALERLREMAAPTNAPHLGTAATAAAAVGGIGAGTLPVAALPAGPFQPPVVPLPPPVVPVVGPISTPMPVAPAPVWQPPAGTVAVPFPVPTALPQQALLQPQQALLQPQPGQQPITGGVLAIPQVGSVVPAVSNVVPITTNIGATHDPPGKKKMNEMEKLRKYNPNLSFKPKIRGGVPDFKTLWAEEHLTLAERKRKKQLTRVQPFELTASSKDEIVHGRRPSPQTRFMAARRRCQSAGAAIVSTTGEQHSSQKHPQGTRVSIPKGTRAHAVRTQAVYTKYIHVPIEREREEAEELHALRAAHRQQRVVNARLKEFLKSTCADNDKIIADKVRAMRSRNRELERESAERLAAMRERVAQLPPIFVEPTHLQDVATERAEAEVQVLQMLKESGVDGDTISAILRGTGGGETTTEHEATIAESTEGATTTTTTTEAKKLSDSADTDAMKKKKRGDKRAKKSKSNASSSSSSSSSGDSKISRNTSASSSDTSSKSAGTSRTAPGGGRTKKDDYDDDDFEDSSSSASV